MIKEDTLKSTANLKFKVIYCDPPWRLEFIKLKMRPNQINMPYPTMTTEAIKNIPVGRIADIKCNLFLWATHTSVPDALDVMKAWGFKYHCIITWNKGNGRPCMGFKRDTEFLIYGYKGGITVRQKGQFIHTLISEDVTEHSRKPGSAYTLIEQNAPTPRIELFARARRPGWFSVGNEIDGKDINQSFKDGNFTYTPKNKWEV